MPTTLSQEIRQLIASVEPQISVLYEPLALYLDRGGKRLRPRLCSLCAEAVGGTAERAHSAGLAIELFHNFSLIHDDIEDNSLLRRGLPCLHIQCGTPVALNLGDLLFCLSTQVMLNAPYEAAEKITLMQMLQQHFLKVFEGQAMELGWHHEKKWELQEQDYFAMVERKTGALIAVACKIGAYLGGASIEKQELLYQWGLSLGIAFQIQDDVLNLTGTEEKYKKEIGGDITEGKRSLIVLNTLNNPSVPQKDKHKLKMILDNNTTDQQAIQWCISLLTQSESIDYAQKKATSIISSTTKALEEHLAINPAQEKLLELAYSLITREA